MPAVENIVLAVHRDRGTRNSKLFTELTVFIICFFFSVLLFSLDYSLLVILVSEDFKMLTTDSLRGAEMDVYYIATERWLYCFDIDVVF